MLNVPSNGARYARPFISSLFEATLLMILKHDVEKLFCCYVLSILFHLNASLCNKHK